MTIVDEEDEVVVVPITMATRGVEVAVEDVEAKVEDIGLAMMKGVTESTMNEGEEEVVLEEEGVAAIGEMTDTMIDQQGINLKHEYRSVSRYCVHFELFFSVLSESGRQGE